MPHVGNHRHKAGQRRRLAVTFAPALAPQINLFRHSGPARHRAAVDLQNGGDARVATGVPITLCDRRGEGCAGIRRAAGPFVVANWAWGSRSV
jgi:hypothetical protein